MTACKVEVGSTQEGTPKLTSNTASPRGVSSTVLEMNPAAARWIAAKLVFEADFIEGRRTNGEPAPASPEAHESRGKRLDLICSACGTGDLSNAKTCPGCVGG